MEGAMTRKVISILTVTGALACTLALVAAPPNDQARSSGETWLALIDSGKYGESWAEASSYFRSRVAEQQWIAMVKGVREPLGAVVSRKLKGVTFVTSLPGAPDGNYAVIQFEASYKNKISAVETLTMMADGDQWRAAGYFLR
jgi:hypothetical protein